MTQTITIAVAQSDIGPDIAANGAQIRSMLQSAAAQSAELVLFPEGALSGYVKSQVKDWDAVDWGLLARELARTSDHAGELGVTAVIGTAQPLHGHRPANSLCVLPGGGRYDKRYLSNTEVSDWYTPGRDPLLVERSNYRFGMTICIEVQFPELFAQYEGLDADCVLHSTYGLGPVGDVMLQAHAATNCLWIAVATPANRPSPPSGIVGPDGQWLARCGTGTDLALATLDRADPRFDIALNKARPWRRRARDGAIYEEARQAATNFSATPLMQ